MTNSCQEALCDVLLTEKLSAKEVKNHLESLKIFNKKFRIKGLGDNKMAIPITMETLAEAKGNGCIEDCIKGLVEAQMLMPFSKTHLIKLASVQKIIQDEIIDLFYEKTKKSLTLEQVKDLPREWQIHGDLLLLPKDCMTDSIWGSLAPEIWHIYCKILRICRIAKRDVIINDDFRSSDICMILGNNGWVKRKENGITYFYDITKCMFSDGNITEKMRVANFDCREKIVVDLFAGIGYFVLPYLVHAGAKMVYACEWNPSAIEALEKNLEANNVSDRCIILEGDNRLVSPKSVADHVNLGLIPSSEASWETACLALNPDKGGWLHIHANINSLEIALPHDDEDGENQKETAKERRKKWNIWALEKEAVFKNMLMQCHAVCEWQCRVGHIEHVKSYAPHVDHIVIDMECRPIHKLSTEMEEQTAP